MALAEIIQKNIAQTSEDTAEGVDRLEGKQDLANELGETLNESAEKGNQIAQTALNINKDEVRRQKEKDREDARKDKGDGDGGKKDGVIKKAGKGIFGLLGSIGKVLGGSFMKILKPMWKILKLLFKVLKFTALGVGLLAAGLFFSMSASDQEAMIEKVIGFFKKVGEVLSMMGKAFGAAFMKNMDDMTDEEGNPIEGLVSKFGKFKEAWSGVLEKLSGISLSVGGKTYKGLEGFATMMGDLFGKIAGWFLDLGTGIATLITDPRLVWAKLKVSISNFFGGIGDTLGRFADKFLNMEFLLSMLPDWMQTMAREAGLVEDASKKRATEKLGEMNKLAEREKLLKQREIDMEKKYQEQKAKVAELDAMLEGDLSKDERARIEKERDLAKDREINAIDLKMEATAERERNIDRFEHAKETYEASMESVIKERAAAIVKQKAGIDMIQVEKDIAELQEERRELINDELDQFGTNMMDATLSQAEKFKEMIGGKETIKAGDIGEELKQKLLVEFGGLGLKEKDLDNVKRVNAFLKEASDRQGDIAKQDAAIAKIKAENQAKIDKHLPEAKRLARESYEKEMGTTVPTLKPADNVPTTHTGGIITEGGIIAAQKGEIIVDDILVNTLVTAAEAMSGISLMNLQRDQQVSTGTGAPIIIQDNSQKQVNQSQPIVIPNSPILPGNEEAPRLIS